MDKYKTEHDVVIIGGGVAGYVAAIKAGQEGLKVRDPLCLGTDRKEDHRPVLTIATTVDRLYREARHSRWHLPQCRMHSFEIVVEQLASLPSDPP